MRDLFLAVQSASVSFGSGNARIRALKSLSISFERGTLSLVMGPSGSGKTTLLSLLGCLLSPEEGTVFIDCVPVSELNEEDRAAVRRAKIGFVFQAFRLLHSLSALENVALGLELRDSEDQHPKTKARELLVEVGLGNKISHQPDGLSPGEKQRVAIARALAGNPPILLADEPTASLDAAAGKNICRILRKQAEENGRTVVVVSHDPRWQEYADRRVTLCDGELCDGELKEEFQAAAR